MDTAILIYSVGIKRNHEENSHNNKRLRGHWLLATKQVTDSSCWPVQCSLQDDSDFFLLQKKGGGEWAPLSDYVEKKSIF